MSIWWMYDNHTFKQLADNPEDAYDQAINCWKGDPWGSLGVKGEHGEGLRVCGSGRENRCEFINQLDNWKESLTRKEP